MIVGPDGDIRVKASETEEGVIKVFLERILKKKVWEIDEQVYIFLDEVQDIEHWQGVLKRFYDQNKNIKFVVSGSASLFIRRKAHESLAGRLFGYHIPPLNFREYLALAGFASDIPKVNIYHIRDSLGDIKELTLKNGSGLQGTFNQFLIRGQFPEAVGMNDIRDVFKYIKESVIKKVLTSDIPKHFGIQKHEELSLLFRAVCRDTAQIVEFKNIASECALSIDTVSSYIDCFKECLLIDVLYNHTRSARRQLRTQKKVYIATPNFMSALFGIYEIGPLMEAVLGHLVETYAFWALQMVSDEIFFAREFEKEVDFYCRWGSEQVLIESKYSDDIRASDIKPMLFFLEKKRIKNGILLTQGLADIRTYGGREIVFLPVWCL